MPSSFFRSALITGASSGIGRALAVELAAPGVTLHLCGRDPERLSETTRACEAKGAVVRAAMLDVTDAAAAAGWISAAGPLDLVIANAGIAAGAKAGERETAAQTRTVLATNLDGALNTMLPAIETMRAAGGGRIAVIASIAAFLPVPGAAGYCASKAAIDAWTVAMAPALRSEAIHLTSVCPGYIRTAMTANNPFPMPGLMEADRAAAIILRGIRRGRTRVVFPWWFGLFVRLIDLLPPQVLATFARTRL